MPIANAISVIEIVPGCQNGNGLRARIQPYDSDSMMPNTTQNRPAEESSTPIQSILFSLGRSVSSTRNDPASSTAQTKMLMRKPQRQL